MSQKSTRRRSRAIDTSIGKTKAEKRPIVNGHHSPAKKSKVDLQLPDVKEGVVLTIGMGDIGQLGLGPDIEEKTKPAVVPDLTNIVAVAAGGLHSVCLDHKGKVYSWGCNDEGALGRVTNCEEDNFEVAQVMLEDEVVQVTAGDCHSAALTADGKVFAWGSFRDNSGPLGFLEQNTIQKTPRQLLEGIPILKIASGHNHLVLLSQSGHVYTCGCGESGQLGRIAEVFATRDSRKRKGIETLLSPLPLKVFKARKVILFEDIWAGGYVTFVKAQHSGDIYGFGLNNYNQLGDEDTNMKFQPVILNAFKGKCLKQISSGQHHSIALDSNGAVYVMGRNEYGRLGLGQEAKDAITPTQITEFTHKAIHVAAGECVSFVVTEKGEAFGFGMGTNNQLSQADDEDVWVPSKLLGKQLACRTVIAVEAGGQHTILLATSKATLQDGTTAEKSAITMPTTKEAITVPTAEITNPSEEVSSTEVTSTTTETNVNTESMETNNSDSL